MKNLILGIVFSAVLVGCAEKQQDQAGKPAPEKQQIAGDVNAGKAVAERDCKACHGLDGKGIAPGIPHLAAQRAPYLMLSIKEYKEGKRTHAALKDMMRQISDADARNVIAFYASQPPIANAAAADVKHSSVYEEGKALAAPCMKCHGEDGNSRTPGTPSLAGQQPHYLVTAMQEYHQGERKGATTKSMSSAASKLEAGAVFCGPDPGGTAGALLRRSGRGPAAERHVRRLSWRGRCEHRRHDTEPGSAGSAVPEKIHQGLPHHAPALGHAALCRGFER